MKLFPAILAATTAALCVFLPLAAAEEVGGAVIGVRRGLEGAGGAFEWGGSFTITNKTHHWLMQKVKGKYADPAMKIVIIPIVNTSFAAMEAVESTAANLKANNCPKVQAGGKMKIVKPGGACYDMQVGTGADSLFEIEAPTASTDVAIFTAHVPTEFEDTRHYLFSGEFTDKPVANVEPVEQEKAKGFIRMSCIQAQTAAAGGRLLTTKYKVKVNWQCDNSICSKCAGEKTGDSPYCFEEDHNGEREFIQMTCSSDGKKATMKVFEGKGVTGCADDTFLDKTENLEYNHAECSADAHGHHAHGATDLSPEQGQSGAATLALMPTTIVAMVAAMSAAF